MILYKKKNYLHFIEFLKKHNYSFFIFSLNSKKEYLNILNNSIFKISYLNNMFLNFHFKGELYIYIYNPKDLIMNFQRFLKLTIEKE